MTDCVNACNRALLESGRPQTLETAGIRLLRWAFLKSKDDAICTCAGLQQTMACTGKQEEVALGERARCQLSVGRRRRRIVLATEDQRRNRTGNGLLLHRGNRLDTPELAHLEILLKSSENGMPVLRCHNLDGCLKALRRGKR